MAIKEIFVWQMALFINETHKKPLPVPEQSLF
jgi:hypothetical protein